MTIKSVIFHFIMTTTPNQTKYLPTIGMEVHAELKTKSKMFCGCPNDPHASEANANVCPVCMAHPGTLPTVNQEAVKALMMMGRAIGGKLSDYSEFDRKNYFYPDIPKAYQISQYKFPFVEGGEIAGVQITRIHLEEDTARSQHDQGEGSLVDFNRAGVPLMELVTEPVIHDKETAVKFAKELQLLLRTLGISDANMDKGEMRVEANISVSNTDTLGTKVEVKNLNSFKSVESAIQFEIKRQSAALETGEKLVQETRGWDENRDKTFSQRTKETAEDYRYFPDPDIPKVKRSEITEWSESRIDEIMPKLPDFKRDNYKNLGLTSDQIEVLIASMDYDRLFNEVLNELSDQAHAKLLANYVTSDLFGLVENEGLSLANAKAASFAELVNMVAADEITSRVAKDLLKEAVFEGISVADVAKDRGLLQQNSTDDLMPMIEQIIADNGSVVSEYKAGKEPALKFLVGQGMKISKGSANPQLLEKLLKEQILR